MDGHAALAGELTTVTDDLDRDFEARLADTSTLAFRLAFSVLRHRQDAEDVAQDAIAKAYRNFAQLRDRERFRAWLARMTWRLAIDRQRANRRRLARELAPDEMREAGTTPPDVETRERAAALWHAIDALPEKLRITVVLANMEGHDIGEVAALLGVPAGTVKSRLFDARRKLKEQLSWMRTSDTTR